MILWTTTIKSSGLNLWAFNQPIGVWDVSAVTSMSYMFFPTRRSTSLSAIGTCLSLSYKFAELFLHFSGFIFFWVFDVIIRRLMFQLRIFLGLNPVVRYSLHEGMLDIWHSWGLSPALCRSGLRQTFARTARCAGIRHFASGGFFLRSRVHSTFWWLPD